MSFDTTPACVRPDAALVDAAKREVPGILNNLESETNYGARPPAPHKLVEVARLMRNLADAGHPKDATQWAIHELIQGGLLEAEGAWKPVFRSGGFSSRRYVPSDFAGKAPLDKLTVRTTDGLWNAWQRDQKKKQQRYDPTRDQPRTWAELKQHTGYVLAFLQSPGQAPFVELDELAPGLDELLACTDFGTPLSPSWFHQITHKYRHLTRKSANEVDAATLAEIAETLGLTRKRPNRPGRKESPNAKNRATIVARWQEFRGGKYGTKKDFCRDQGIKLRDLDRMLAAERAKRLRKRRAHE